jgi:hypothetical protein
MPIDLNKGAANKSNQQPNPQPNRPAASADRNRAQVSQQSSDALASTQGRQAAKLTNLKAHVDRAMNERTFTVEAMSDLLADIHDPKLLEQEIMARTAQKIEQRQQESDAIDWDSFGFNLLELPASPVEQFLFGSSAIGQLPASAKLSS